MDRRRQPYVAVDIWLLFSTTTGRLLAEFGPAGPLAWVGLLAAAKRAPIHGTVSCVNETDFWDQVGVPAEHRGTMTMDAFLKLLGHLKQTSRTHSGRRLDVRISNFETWQQAPKSFREAERKRRKRAQTSADYTETLDSQSGDDTAPETRRDDRYVSSTSERDGDVAAAAPPQQAAERPTNGRVPRDQQPAYHTAEHHKHYRPDKAAQYAANVGSALTPAELEHDLTVEFAGIPGDVAHNLAERYATAEPISEPKAATVPDLDEAGFPQEVHP